MPCTRPVRYLLFLLTLYFASASAQQHFNLSALNGLPSNHVYFLMKDHYGYLWIASEKGVLRYNGYTLKKFGLEEGLSNDDVWHLYEDRRGRIWLGTLAAEMGYLYNDQYHLPGLDNPTGSVLGGHDLRESPGGITFSALGDNLSNNLFLEVNDSLINFSRLIAPKAYSAYDGSSILVYGPRRAYRFFQEKGMLRKETIPHLPTRNTDIVRFLLVNSLLFYDRQSGRLTLYSTRDFRVRRLQLFSDSTEHIYTIYLRERFLYLVTNKHFYRLDTSFNLEKKYVHTRLVPDSSATNSTFVNLLEDDLWGTCISTADRGIYMDNRSYPFRKLTLDLAPGARYVGSADDSDHFWYDPAGERLLCMDKQFHTWNTSWTGLGDVMKVEAVNRDSALIFSRKTVYWLDRRDYTISDYFHKVRMFSVSQPDGSETQLQSWLGAIIRSGVYRNGKLYALQVGFNGMIIRNDTAIAHILVPQRLTAIVYDRLREVIWQYNEKNIFFFRVSDPAANASVSVLKYTGIRKIEQLLVDNKYGNVFVKVHGRLYVYDGRSIFPKQLFAGYSLGNTQITIEKDRLVAAGNMGVLCSYITGPGRVSEPVYYPNLKNSCYSVLKDLIVSGSQILINTDKGAFVLPADPKMTVPFHSKVRLLVRYRDTLHQVGSRDTLQLDQGNLLLQFDVINPSGTGTLRYRYRVESNDKGWKEQKTAEVYLSGLKPGKYYTLSVVPLDDVWVSQPYRLQLYVVPHWWQTGAGKSALFVAGAVVAALLIALTVYLTNGRAARKHAQRKVQLELHNLRLETELKKVYAQINPHFIFNTLSTTAYFVKKSNMVAANRHIVLFSRLLRSYLRSARSRLISLEEEMANIDDYIQLQLARFEHKFGYRITIDPRIDAGAFRVPPMLIQPLVENAINHGLLHKEEKGFLRIDVATGDSAGEAVILIDDDGIGREAARQYQAENGTRGTSYGSDIIDQLIATFNAHNDAHISIEYADKALPLTGTTVKLTIKHHP